MEPGLLTGRMARERIERLPDDDWRKHDARFQDAVAYPSGADRALAESTRCYLRG